MPQIQSERFWFHKFIAAPTLFTLMWAFYGG